MSWREDAECRGMDTSLFFCDPGDHVRESAALAACGRCDVRDECLAEALIFREAGIWGGTSERQRRRIREGRGVTTVRRPEVAGHGKPPVS